MKESNYYLKIEYDGFKSFHVSLDCFSCTLLLLCYIVEKANT